MTIATSEVTPERKNDTGDLTRIVYERTGIESGEHHRRGEVRERDSE